MGTAIRGGIKSVNQSGEMVLSGSFQTNGSSAPAAATIKGKGFTVSAPSTGVYTITLADKYLDCYSITASGTGAADVGVKASVPNLTAGTFTLTTTSSGTAANIASNAANRVNFTLHLKGPMC